MRAPVFGRLCPPNSCNTTRIDPRVRLHPVRLLRLLRPLHRLRPLRRLHLLAPLRLLRPLRPLRPAPPSARADLGGPPPYWNSSKPFYSLNIRNTWMTTMPFFICINRIYSFVIKCAFLTNFHCVSFIPHPTSQKNHNHNISHLFGSSRMSYSES